MSTPLRGWCRGVRATIVSPPVSPGLFFDYRAQTSFDFQARGAVKLHKCFSFDSLVRLTNTHSHAECCTHKYVLGLYTRVVRSPRLLDDSSRPEQLSAPSTTSFADRFYLISTRNSLHSLSPPPPSRIFFFLLSFSSFSFSLFSPWSCCFFFFFFFFFFGLFTSIDAIDDGSGV